jgi:hypothetical protein
MLRAQTADSGRESALRIAYPTQLGYGRSPQIADGKATSAQASNTHSASDELSDRQRDTSYATLVHALPYRQAFGKGHLPSLRFTPSVARLRPVFRAFPHVPPRHASPLRSPLPVDPTSILYRQRGEAFDIRNGGYVLMRTGRIRRLNSVSNLNTDSVGHPDGYQPVVTSFKSAPSQGSFLPLAYSRRFFVASSPCSNGQAVMSAAFPLIIRYFYSLIAHCFKYLPLRLPLGIVAMG